MEEAPNGREPVILGPTKQEVIDKLLEMGAFLHGSRDRFKNYNIDDPTDWDFAIDQEDFRNYWPPYTDLNGVYHTPNNSELCIYLYNNFIVQDRPDLDPETEQYGDDHLIAYYKHTDYPDITIQVKDDLELWKKVWYRTPTDYWEQYLWKSAPNTKEYIEESEENALAWKRFARQTWNMLWQAVDHPNEEDVL